MGRPQRYGFRFAREQSGKQFDIPAPSQFSEPQLLDNLAARSLIAPDYVERQFTSIGGCVQAFAGRFTLKTPANPREIREKGVDAISIGAR